MRISILNGSQDSGESQFEIRLAAIAKRLSDRGHTVQQIDLKDLDLHRCSGCFGCWVKTPGECLIADESNRVCEPMVTDDLVLHASPLQMGFVSSLMRLASERMIPILMPYMKVDDGAIRHQPRYRHYARLGLLYGEEADTDHEDLEIARDIYQQIAAELSNDLAVFASVFGDEQEVVNAIDGF